LTISVVAPDGTSPTATLHVSDLEIDQTPLPASVAGSDYRGREIVAPAHTVSRR
jgi:hypothetical protein